MSLSIRQIAKPESGFPAWNGDYASTSEIQDRCPVSEGEMAEYMVSCHFHYCLSETPTTFDQFVMRGWFDVGSREFWLWSCVDGFGRIWDIIVGRGDTPFYGKTGKHLWMHGEHNKEIHAPCDLIAREYPEHIHSLNRPN